MTYVKGNRVVWHEIIVEKFTATHVTIGEHGQQIEGQAESVKQGPLRIGTILKITGNNEYLIQPGHQADSIVLHHSAIIGKVVHIPLTSELQARMRPNTTAYDIVYRPLITNGSNSITSEGLKAIFALVDFASNYEAAWMGLAGSIVALAEQLGLPTDGDIHDIMTVIREKVLPKDE